MKQVAQWMVGGAVLAGMPLEASPVDLVAKGAAVAHQLTQHGEPLVFSAIPEPSQYGLFLALAVAAAVVWRRVGALSGIFKMQ